MMQDHGRYKNMKLLGQSTLNGFGNGGEGFGLKELSDGRRILFVAHEGPPKDFTVLDVTNPSGPKVIQQIDLPHHKIRSNSLAIVGDILLVAYQSGLDPNPSNFNVEHAGMGVWDISNVEHPRQIDKVEIGDSGSDSAALSAFLIFLSRYMADAAEDPQRRRPDIALACRILGWQPAVPRAEGLRCTIDYYCKEEPPA
jgi:hypothetical protein